MSGPLSHLTVIELAGIGPGPFAGMLFADMGARVIRVDRLPPRTPPTGLAAMLRNDSLVDRGRESVALNLKDPRAVEAVLALVATADVLIEGFRPGVVEQMGLGPEVCLARNPRLIYGRITGWGQTGPLAQAAGHDLNYIALSGALHAMGDAHAPPTPPLNLVGDYGGGGMLLVVGVLAAWAQAQHSGQGQVVDAAMTDGAALLMSAQYALHAKGFWHDRRGTNFLDGAAPFYGAYACADGKYVAVGAIEPAFYRELLRLCGVEDPAFEAQWEAGAWPALRAKFAGLFSQRTRDAWCADLEGTDACFAPVLSMAEAPAHPHNRARGTFATMAGATMPAPAPRFDRTPSRLAAPPPEIGGDTLRILSAAGLAPETLAGWQRDGVLHDAGEQP